MLRAQRRPREPVTTGQVNLTSGDKGDAENGLARLTLTIVEVIRQVLERQAFRRVESGTLTAEQVERLGLAFIRINHMIDGMSRQFGIKPEEIKATLSSILRSSDRGLMEASLADLVDRLVEKRTVISGRVKIAVSDVDLVGLDLLAMLYPIYGGEGSLRQRVVRRCD